jgi:hypothetical protein
MNASLPDILMVDAKSRLSPGEIGQASIAVIGICFTVWVLLDLPGRLIVDRLAHMGVLAAMLYVVAWSKGGRT